MKKYYGLLLILISFLFLLKIVPFNGNFPLNDDWSYSYSVKHLFDTGQLKLSDWGAPNIVFQVFWGWLWCKIAGVFSFAYLRLSTLFLGLAGIIFFYLLLKKIGHSEKNSLIGAFCLLLNPVWFVSSYTFMTDIPYLSVSLISVYFYYSAEKSENEFQFIAGSLFAGFAYLIRQLGIFIPLSLSAYLLLNHKLSVKRTIFICALPLLAFVSHWYWLNYVHGPTWAYVAGRTLKITFLQLYPRLAGSTFYTGLFLLPFSLGLFFTAKNKNRVLSFAWTIFIMALTACMCVLVISRGWLPYFENIIGKYGLGTITVAGAGFKPRAFLSEPLFLGAITILGGASFVYLISLLGKESKKTELLSGKLGFIFICFTSQFIVSLIYFAFFDRYLLTLLPAGIILSLELISRRKSNVFVTVLALLLTGAYSLAGTSDYLNWNRAKWDAGMKAVETGLQPGEIANGFDWDGWFTYQVNMDRLKTMKPVSSIGEWEWQSLNKYKAIVSFSPAPQSEGLVMIAKSSYNTPFSSKPADIYVWGAPKQQ